MSTRPHGPDAGFSLVEVVVAMLLFGLLAVALLPLTAQVVGLSAVNRDLIAANELAASRLATARAKFPDTEVTSCASVADWAEPWVNQESGDLLWTYLAVDCDVVEAFPGTVTLVVDVHEEPREFGVRTGPALATLSTSIVVNEP